MENKNENKEEEKEDKLNGKMLIYRIDNLQKDCELLSSIE